MRNPIVALEEVLANADFHKDPPNSACNGLRVGEVRQALIMLKEYERKIRKEELSAQIARLVAERDAL